MMSLDLKIQPKLQGTQTDDGHAVLLVQCGGVSYEIKAIIENRNGKQVVILKEPVRE